MRRWMIGLILALAVALPAHAQSRVPYGAVVRDAQGTLWVVLDQRYRLPIYPIDEDALAAIPASDQWALPSSRDGWTLGPQPDWDISATGQSSLGDPAEQIVLEGTGTKNTDPFHLRGGNYRVRWTATPRSDSCSHSAEIEPVQKSSRPTFYNAGRGSPQGRRAMTDETVLYGIPAGSYYLSTISGCDWQVTIDPLQ